jgi:hypothetical protein
LPFITLYAFMTLHFPPSAIPLCVICIDCDVLSVTVCWVPFSVCGISGFRRGVVDAFAVLGCYAG